MSTIQRINLSTLHWQDSRARDCVLRGGSKAGAYEYLYETQPQLRKHLPKDAKYLSPGEDVRKFLDGVNLSMPKVIRGCHPLDFVGMVDVIDTEKDIFGRFGVINAIGRVREQAQNAKVKSFVEYESGEPFDGEIGIQVADYYNFQDAFGNVHSCKRGSIVEHPHERGIYRICMVSPSEGRKEYVEEEICDASGRAIRLGDTKTNSETVYKTDEQYPAVSANEGKKIIALYKAIYDSGLIPPEYSFQMEYGIDNKDEIIFFQARLFRPFQERADFDLSPKQWTHTTFPWHSFGITPKGGIELVATRLEKDRVDKLSKKSTVAYSYNAINHRESTPLDVQPNNMAAFLAFQNHVLEHGYYRWLQKALIAISGAGGVTKIHEMVSSSDKPVKIRICSNGIYGGISIIERKTNKKKT